MRGRAKEEADLDELEWMACEQFPADEDADLYDGYADVPPAPDDPPDCRIADELHGRQGTLGRRK